MYDNYEAWKMHDAEENESLDRLPVCDYCGEPIQDEYLYEIDGELYCEDCMKEHFRKPTDKYMED